MNTTTPQNVIITFIVMGLSALISEPTLISAIDNAILWGTITFAALIYITEKPEHQYFGLFGAYFTVHAALLHFSLTIPPESSVFEVAVSESTLIAPIHTVLAGLVLAGAGMWLHVTYRDFPQVEGANSENGWVITGKAIGIAGLMITLLAVQLMVSFEISPTSPTSIGVAGAVGLYFLARSVYTQYTTEQNTNSTTSQ